MQCVSYHCSLCRSAFREICPLWLPPVLLVWNAVILFLNMFLLILERERNMGQLSSACPSWGSGPHPGMCPNRELMPNQLSHSVQGWGTVILRREEMTVGGRRWGIQSSNKCTGRSIAPICRHVDLALDFKIVGLAYTSVFCVLGSEGLARKFSQVRKPCCIRSQLLTAFEILSSTDPVLVLDQKCAHP